LVSGSRAAAEDAVQEALARAWERDERGHRIESLEAWVTRVATNLARSRWRRLRVERRHASERTSPAEPSGELVDLRRALDALPRRQREVTVLRYYLDLDVREIADALRVSEGTVKTSLHRARSTLAAALGDEDHEEASERAES
jgi:RNA polymerase sigma-70 factor, ECF subfamily